MAATEPPSASSPHPILSSSSSSSPPSQPQTTTSDRAPSSTPVEMSQLQPPQERSQPDTLAENPPQIDTNIDDTELLPPSLRDGNVLSDGAGDSHDTSKEQSSTSATADASITQPARKMERRETNPIGPAQETNPSMSIDPASGPAVLLTLLLITGARHPFRIDGKYLKKRNVPGTSSTLDGVEDSVDPWGISVYTVKELIWRDWREEWESRPSSPSSIRLIHFGRLLDDKTALKDCRLQESTPNVIHMTIKPSDFGDDDEQAAKGGKSTSRHDRRDSETGGGGLCRCVIL